MVVVRLAVLGVFAEVPRPVPAGVACAASADNPASVQVDNGGGDQFAPNIATPNDIVASVAPNIIDGVVAVEGVAAQM